MLEQDLVPYTAVTKLGDGNALVLAPHPDDEIFGCAGAMLAHHAQGDAVTIVLVTDGAMQGTSPSMRLSESCQAAAQLGLAAPTSWSLPDRGVEYGEALIARITEAIRDNQAQWVYAPWPGELHPDHRAIALAAIEAVRRIGGDLHLAQYEVSAPMRPNRLLDITAVVAQKQQAMAAFGSQLAFSAYDEQINALNRYRAYTLGNSVSAAEAYFVAAATELQQSPSVARHTTDTTRFSNSHQPLVSVLVRSANRPTLQAALDSIDAQTYGHIEVVIANSTGKTHAPVSPGRFPLRWVDTGTSLDRAAAANALLDVAQGDWLIFLDDDDWFETGHIAKLVHAGLSGQALAIYTGVRCVDLQGEPLASHFDEPFDAQRLLVANFIPIHAVLFHRKLLALGCRFDEQFKVYEDWDFWLQVAVHGPLQHLAGLSAVYRINPQSDSGAHDWAPRKAGREALFAKWTQRAGPALALASAAKLVEYEAILQTRASEYASLEAAKATESATHSAVLEAQVRSHQLALHATHQAHHQALSVLHQRLWHIETQLHATTQAHDQATQHVKNAEALIADLRHSLAASDLHASNLTMLREAVEAERDAFKFSLSWRVTQPLRVVGHQLRRIKRAWHTSRAAAHKLGGWLPLIQRAAQIVRREGYRGLVDRARGIRHQHLPSPTTQLTEYERWIAEYDTPSDADKAAMARQLAAWDYQPRISILLPAFNSPEVWLRKALDSVLAQIYPHWQLCIADDASTDPIVKQVLDEYAHRDGRIQVCYRPVNGHISAASNSALALCDGEFTALFDHDDELPAHALYCVVKALQHRRDAAILFSDEDKIDTNGRRFGPYFKPDFNYDLFLSQNMVSHLGVYRTQLMRDVGGFREGCEGSQDYDLALRVMEGCNPEQIIHIPRVLYHWRVIPGSTASSNDAKPYAFLAAQSAVESHLSRIGVRASVVEAQPDMRMLRVKYPLTTPQPSVTLLIAIRDGGAALARCLASLYAHTHYDHMVVHVVSADSVTVLTPPHSLINAPHQRHKPISTNEPINQALLGITTSFVCLLDDCVEFIQDDWLAELVSHAERSDVGAVGPKLLRPDQQVHDAGWILGCNGLADRMQHGKPRVDYGYSGRAVLHQQLSTLSGSCLLVRKNILDQLGGLHRYDAHPMGTTIDLCLGIQSLQFKLIWTPFSELLLHTASPTDTNNDSAELAARCNDEARLRQRWGALLDNDPAYNPNLSLATANFDLAWPPRLGAEFAVP